MKNNDTTPNLQRGEAEARGDCDVSVNVAAHAVRAAPERRLLPHHQKLIDDSSITETIAAARGYFTATKKCELGYLGFSPGQRLVPALVIPIRNASGEIANYQARPDQPRIGKHGKAIKYETPAGSQLAIDVPPTIRKALQDPACPLMITEGARKADAAVSHGLVCIDLLGVWGWKGRNEHGGKVALPDWHHIPLNDRTVYLAFDSDVMTKASVHQALTQLKLFLESKGAQVQIIYLPDGPDSLKVGLDDYLAAGHSTSDLLALAEPSLRPMVGAPELKHPYRATPGGLEFLRQSRGQTVVTPLCNFAAWIVADVEEDNGSERQGVFHIEAEVRGRSVRFSLPAGEFAAMRWVEKNLGAAAVIAAGTSIREHTRAAIQHLSGDIPRQELFTHTGWRAFGDAVRFLHAAGAIGTTACGCAAVRLDGGLERYRLPEAPSRDTARSATAISLKFLDTAQREQSWPLYASVWAAPLGAIVQNDFVLWLTGKSGSRKSSMAALMLCHYGSFDRNSLPANLLSTGNSLELLAFAAKDVPFVVDNFVPTTDPKLAAQQAAAVNRLVYGIGDGHARRRATVDARLREAMPARCLALVTAEVSPPGAQSAQARTLEIQWPEACVDLHQLTEAQFHHVDRYPVATAGYLAWLASRFPTLREELPWQIRMLQRTFEARGVRHGRVAETAAKLCVGVHQFLLYATELGAITTTTQATLMAEAERCLLLHARRTGRSQAERRPTVTFREYFGTLLAQKRIYLVDRHTGGAPQDDPQIWGYRPEADASGERPLLPLPGARFVGWVDRNEGSVYLIPSAAHQAVTQFAREADARFTVTQRGLGDALREEGLLIRTAADRTESSLWTNNRSQWTWVLDQAFVSIDPELPRESGESGEDEGSITSGLATQEQAPSGNDLVELDL